MSFLNRTRLNGAGLAWLALGWFGTGPPPKKNVASSSALSLVEPLQGVSEGILKEKKGAYFSRSSQKSSPGHFCFGLFQFLSTLQRVAIWQFPVWWIYYCNSSESTRKKIDKIHLCALAIRDQKLSKIIKMELGSPKTERLPGARFWQDQGS